VKLFRIIEVAQVTIGDIRAKENAGSLGDRVAAKFYWFDGATCESRRWRVETQAFLENGGGIR
jgi:hypothetical protein